MALTDESISSVESYMSDLKNLKNDLSDLKSTLNSKTLTEKNFQLFLQKTKGGMALAGELKHYQLSIDKILAGYDQLVSQTNKFLEKQREINSRKVG